MTLIAAGLAAKKGEGLGQHVMEKAKTIVAEIILPREVTGHVIEKYIRKAILMRVWYKFPRVTKALLRTTRHLPKIKSSILLSILREVFLQIELATLRGKAYFYGVIIAMQKGFSFLSDFVRNAHRLLTLGIFYLNNPSIYKVYG